MLYFTRTYIEEIARFRESMIEGLLISTPLGRARLYKKHTYIAETSLGTFQWAEIFFAERGVRYEE